jgi:hypothetical protein
LPQNPLVLISMSRVLFSSARIATRVPAVIAALLITGCASLSPEQCQHADWRQIGYTDGVEGASAYRINDHAKACAEVGVKPNLDEYLRGREQGFQTYCRPGNAFALGRRGVSHNGAECQEAMKPAFYGEYDRGYQLHLIEADIAQRRSQIDRNHHQMPRNDERIAGIRTELAKSDLPADRRTSLLNEFNRLVEQKNSLGRENSLLSSEADRLQFQLQMRLREFGR